MHGPSWSTDDRALLFVCNLASTWDLWRQNLDPDVRPRGDKERVTTGLDSEPGHFRLVGGGHERTPESDHCREAAARHGDDRRVAGPPGGVARDRWRRRR